MKKLLLSMMVLALVISCGKDNKVSSNGVGAVGLSNPLLVNNTQAQALVSQINNYTTAFGTGTVYDAAASQSCEVKSWYTICKSVSNGGTGTTWNAYMAAGKASVYYYQGNKQGVVHSQVNVDAKRNELVTILNAATQIQIYPASGGSVYMIQHSNGGYYVIDTRLPLQANPAQATSSSENYLFYRAY